MYEQTATNEQLIASEHCSQNPTMKIMAIGFSLTVKTKEKNSFSLKIEKKMFARNYNIKYSTCFLIIYVALVNRMRKEKTRNEPFP